MRSQSTTAVLATLVTLALTTLPSLALDQTQANTLAAHLLSQISRTNGFASIQRCGNGTLPLALIQTSNLTVLATDPDESDVNVSRAAAVSTGLLGKRLYIERAAPTPILLADNFTDLVVMFDLTDAELSTVSFDAVQAALCPGGKAYIGRALAEGPGLSAGALTTWISGKSGASVITDAQGTWAVITKSDPAGVDIWTHRFHGPDNNPSSGDAVVQFPFLLQYRVKPYQNGRYGSVVTSNGRMYIAFNDQSGWPTYRRFLRAYNIYNGSLLWSRNLTLDWPSDMGKQDPEVYPTSYSCIVARGDELFLMKGGEVLRLNGATGQQLGAISFGTGTQRVKWIAIDGGLLYALVGDSAMVEAGAFYGNTVKTYNLATSAMGWSQTETGRIDNREIAISTGKLFYYVKGERVVARSASTGAQLWVNSAVAATLDSHGSNSSALTFCVGGHDGMLASQWGVYLASAEDATYVGLSAADGSVQWTTGSGGNRASHKVLTGGVLFSKSVTDHAIVNAATAQPITSGYNGFNFGSGCGPMSTSRDWFFGQAGGPANRLSPTLQSFPYRSYKVDCSSPPIVSNGMLLYPASGCGCPDLHRGYMGMVPAGSFQFDRAAVESERLEKGPAWNAISSTLNPTASDWWTHRGTNNRTGMVPVTVATAGVREMWKYSPQHLYDTTRLDVGLDFRPEQEPTPVVSVGGQTFWGGTDGYIRCHNGAAQVWSFATGGRIYAAPTVTGGCVYAGSADGYAYCIDASTGALVWRFRAAPVERRLNLYGHLASNWPVVTGVLVKDGRAYFGAGIDEEYGSHVYCVNSTTGALLWQNNNAGTMYNATARLGFVPSGYMTIVGSKLWVRAHHGRDGVFDINTGALEPVPAVLNNRNGGPTVRGRDIGLIDNTHMLRGGRLLYSDPLERGAHVRSLWYLFLRLDASGTPTYPEFQVSDWASSVTPAWDSQQFYYTLSGEQFLEGWNTARFTQVIDSFQNAWNVATRPSDWPNWKEVTVTPSWVPGWQGNAPTTPMSLWRQTPITDSVIELRAMALSSNALVVTQARHHKYEYSNWKWFVEILDRASGARLWYTRLPSEPLWQGLSIARDGSVLVALRTGEIICYGAGTVSVARGSAMPATAPVNIPVPSTAFTAATSTTERAETISRAQEREMSSEPSNADTRSQPPRVALSGAIIDSQATFDRRTVQGTLAAACVTEGNTASVFGPSAPPRFTPQSTRWSVDLACVDIVSVTSSDSRQPHRAQNTLDRDIRTRWNAPKGEQWLRYDLGAARNINSVSIAWHVPRGSQVAFTIESSDDDSRYETLDSGVLDGGGTQTILRAFLPVSARYVRLRVDSESSPQSPSVFEVAVHEGASVGCVTGDKSSAE